MQLSKIKLSRITDGKEIIPEIEGLRFISIMLVTISHINNNMLRAYPPSQHIMNAHPLAVFLEECGIGVHIFFFISGFILAIPFLNAYVYNKRKISLKRYYYRRLTRIEPPYIISLIFFSIIALFVLRQPWSETFEHFTASALYLHNNIYDRISTINPVAWTLEIEIQFYIVFPLLASILFFKNSVLRKTVIFTAFLLAALTYTSNITFLNTYHLSKSLFAYCSIFIMGIAMADIYLREKIFFTGTKKILFDLPGMMALYCIVTLSGYQNPLCKLFIFGCYIVLFTGIFKGKFLNNIFTNKYIVIAGGMCYSVYLMHYAVIYFNINHFTKYLFTQNYPLDIFIQTVALLPFVFIVSAVFFVFFERPFMDITWPGKLRKFFTHLFYFKKRRSS